VGIGATISVAVFQERNPVLNAECHVAKDGDPCVLECEVYNSGKKEARDVFVSFNEMLPLETRVLAAPERGITLSEAENLPDPHRHPELSKTQKAFAVRIPLIAPKDTIIFQIKTTHPDNQRAGKQVMKIREEIIDILKKFDKLLQQKYPQEINNWNIEALISARIKEENFFLLGKLSYEQGRVNVQFLTDEEQLAKAVNQDLYHRYKKEFIDIYQGRPHFKAPVVRIKATAGESTIAIYPPYVNTYVDLYVPMDKLKQGNVIELYPPVPKSY
jgi:hypothetical protein